MAARSDFAAGQVVTVFRSRLAEGAGEAGYHDLAAELEARARAVPGFVDVKGFTADDGERVTVVTFADARSHERWRTDPSHRVGQRRGREAFYETYSVQVAICDRVTAWERPSS